MATVSRCKYKFNDREATSLTQLSISKKNTGLESSADEAVVVPFEVDMVLRGADMRGLGLESGR